jgi:hypothetical protein
LVDAEKAGAVTVRVFDDETRTVYMTRIDTIWQYGFTVQRGHGDQIALSLDRWSVNGQKTEPRRKAQTKQKTTDSFGVVQMALFENTP